MIKTFHKFVKKEVIEEFAQMTPAIRCSICTGEKTAGFLDANGKFRDLMLIRSDGELEEFCKKYSVHKEEIRTIY
ncbi:MAG: aspartate dehydrogenase [Lachnospiraceae bacterium]